MRDNDVLTSDEAISLLPEGEYVHTFANPAGMMLGADCGRQNLIDRLKGAKIIKLTGDMARSMGHGMVFQHAEGVLFVATDKAKLEALDE